ncbi:MAG: transporter [Gemmatimonadota bacterium]
MPRLRPLFPLALLTVGLFPRGAVRLARAQEMTGPPPLVTDRPDFTESATAVVPGRLQAELGYTFSRTGDEERHAIGELLIRIGIADRLEGRVGLNSFAVVDGGPGSGPSGLEDLTLGAKLVLVRPGTGASRGVPRVALLGSVSLPTGDDAIGAAEAQPSGLVALAWDLSDRVGLGANAGVTSVHGGAGRVAEGSASVALGVALTDRLGAFFEAFRIFPEAAGGPDTSFLDAGLTLGLGPDLQIDWRAGIGLDDPGPNYFTGLGVAIRR